MRPMRRRLRLPDPSLPPPPRTRMDWATRYRLPADEASAAPTSPEDAVRHLLTGNAEFVREAAPDVPAPSTATPPDGTTPVSAADSTPPPRQAPFCIILGCSDARVPAELV